MPSDKIPQPTGDGLTPETAYFFPDPQGNHDGLPMAYAFMKSKGTEYLPKRQKVQDMADTRVLESWETEAGVFWFRYHVRRDWASDTSPDKSTRKVEDEELAQILEQVDRTTPDQPEDDHPEKHELARQLLETVPARYENHVEVLRRRLQHCVYPDNQLKEKTLSVHWARSLVEAAPYNEWNWLYLDNAVQRLEGITAAAEVLREGIRRIGPHFSLYYCLSGHLCSLGRLDEAKEAMKLAMEEDPFALASGLENKCFEPIHDFIRELAQSESNAPAVRIPQ